MRLIDQILLIFFLLFSLFAGGCIQVSGDVYLNDDGSGEVRVTEVISPEGLLVLQGLKAAGQIPDIDYISTINEIDENELAARADNFASGLKFESAEQVTLDDGSIGRCATYSFTDISKVKIYQDNRNTDKSVFDISYTPGKLIISSEVKDDEFDQMIEGLEDVEKMPDQLKPFFKGMKFSVTLRTPSSISNTNARYPLKDKSGITLVYLDLGEIINSPMALAALKNFSFELQEGSVQAAQGFDYFKVEPQEKVSVEF